MKNIRPILGVIVASAAILSQQTAGAASAIQIMGQANNSAALYDDNGSGNFPVITTILTAPSGSIYNPGTSLDGYTNRNWSFLAQDTTGSLDVFYSTTVLSSYTPHVGDQLVVQGNYGPFNGIPEIGNSTANPLHVTVGTSGNPFYSPSPVLTTIPTINVGTNGAGLSLSGLGGQLLHLQNVTISGTGAANWQFHTNVTGFIKDPFNNSMTMFLWASSYSACASIAAGGGPVPVGEVDMIGFLSDFYSTITSSLVTEFVPIAIVPEPMTLSLCGLAVLGWGCYRFGRRKS